MKRFAFYPVILTAWFAAGAMAQIPVPPIRGDQAPPNLMVLKPEVESAFINQDSTQNELYQLLLFDLQFSGAFTVREENTQAAFLKRQDSEQNTFDFAAWLNVQVDNQPLDFVVKTRIIPRGPGFMQLNLLVFDVQQQQRAIGTAYGQNPPFAINDMRRAGHKATAEIISTLTQGEVTPITETRILFVNQSQSKRVKELFIMDYDGWEGSIRQLTFYNSVTVFPDFSPSGNEVAYISFRDQWPDAYVHNLVTGNVTPLAQFKGTNNTPRWFPDGRRLALSISAFGNPEICVIDKSGSRSSLQRITDNRAIDQAPDVSLDGSRIAFVSDRIGSPQIYVMGVDGSGARRVSFIERKCDTPIWSPVQIGGTEWIAFTGFYSSLQADVFIVNPETTEYKMITDGNGDNKNATWSPNGKYLVFSSNRLGKNDIFIAPSDPNTMLPNGKRYHRLTFMAGDNLSPVWSPK